MTRISLYPPETTAHAVTVHWEIDPPSDLYRQCQFTLRFPESVDVSALSEAVWWRVALVCLHSHWPLLRPCRVDLPVKLRPGEAESWSRLVAAEATTLDAYRGITEPTGGIEVAEHGSSLASTPSLAETGRCATAFSGGKDSLLQTGILTELTPRPLLVTTTSPMPPWADHVTARRRAVLADITRRRDVDLVEVQSDYRSIWDNAFARRLGYPVGVNEISDTFLYFASLLVSGLALGATHLFLASEAEVQENTARDGQIVQHPHFMYSAVTQRALQTLLRPLGVRYSSLTSPLHSFQVQELLWRRYSDLRDLQYSCWRVGADEATCSRCSQCLRIALCALALGDTPTRMGVDLVRLLRAMRHWSPERIDPAQASPLPRAVVTSRLHGHAVRYLRVVTPRQVLRALVDGSPDRLLGPGTWLALLAYARLRRRTTRHVVDDRPGYRSGFLRLVDPLLRDAVGSLYATYFSPERDTSYAGVLERSDALTRWIVEPVGGEP